ncbi:hypothetical protein [Mucilaginibacter ginsenosidivorans]|uniref:Uncharacterized protein n=1 Tax=Mucilaginibacter ginsenosidivorans TaxID=398053 RepID=A0A5B8UTK6_9SPHI|nr:hypothetical protein [Mucilaginibacter ginsenosidivorans]QEC62437.1 hypothetical protein FRZ54_07500 [Mucilaginibacter ginsenosidivorans]
MRTRIGNIISIIILFLTISRLSANAAKSSFNILTLPDTGKIASVLVLTDCGHQLESIEFFKANGKGFSVACGVYQVSGYRTIIPDTLTGPVLCQLEFKYTDWKPINNTIALFLVPGENITVKVTSSALSQEYSIEGPVLTMDYQTRLLAPVQRYNTQINQINAKLRSTGADTVLLKKEMNQAIAGCFNVPRQYILSNPHSLLCMTALRMMGNGDPTLKEPVSELDTLFHSLSSEIQNSDEGKDFGERLRKYFQTTGK